MRILDTDITCSLARTPAPAYKRPCYTGEMPHRSLITAFVIDVPGDVHADEVAFWSGATGKDLVRLSHPEYHGARLTPTLVLLIQELGEGAPRVHVDIHTDDVDAEVARLTALGATQVDRLPEWAVMRDPAGLPFCVVTGPPGELDAGPAITWP